MDIDLKGGIVQPHEAGSMVAVPIECKAGQGNLVSPKESSKEPSKEVTDAAKDRDQSVSSKGCFT
jgi:hypothetical protein